MDVVSGSLPYVVLILSGILFTVLMLIAVFTAPWYKITDNSSSHIFLGLTLGVAVIWMLRASVMGEIHFHLLLTTSLYLMFGWQFALFSIVVVQVIITLAVGSPLHLLPINTLLLGGVPVLITGSLLVLSKQHLPHHFFVFIFINCFFAAGLSMFGMSMSTLGLYYFFSYDSVYQSIQDFFPFSILLSLPEAAINGILMSGFIAYRPSWVAMFHDEVYIDGK